MNQLLVSGRPRLGRPVGPTEGRGPRPYDPTRISEKFERALRWIVANPDQYRYAIAAAAGASCAYLSTVTTSPRGVAGLAELEADKSWPRFLYRLPEQRQ